MRDEQILTGLLNDFNPSMLSLHEWSLGELITRANHDPLAAHVVLRLATELTASINQMAANSDSALHQIAPMLDRWPLLAGVGIPRYLVPPTLAADIVPLSRKAFVKGERKKRKPEAADQGKIEDPFQLIAHHLIVVTAACRALIVIRENTHLVGNRLVHPASSHLAPVHRRRRDESLVELGKLLGPMQDDWALAAEHYADSLDVNASQEGFWKVAKMFLSYITSNRPHEYECIRDKDRSKDQAYDVGLERLRKLQVAPGSRKVKQGVDGAKKLKKRDGNHRSVAYDRVKKKFMQILQLS